MKLPVISLLHTKNSDPLEDLRFQYGEFTLYKAGLPGFPRAFMRDGVISALLASNHSMLNQKIKFAASIQGTKQDPITGEQPGAIFHEYDVQLKDGVGLLESPGFTTKFNASDTTALFLIAHEEYQKLTDDFNLSQNQKENIKKAAEYILTHLDKDNIFFEDPKLSGAKKYALKVTYWKDSILLDRTNGEPVYPVVYPLVQIQNLAGLRSAARLLSSKILEKRAEKMKNSTRLLFDKKLGNFPIAIDGNGKISSVSSDGLEALFYLDPEDLTPLMIKEIINSSKVLETKLGYRVLDPQDAQRVPNAYHARTLWTHEQAIIHKAAVKHLEWAKKTNDKELIDSLNHAKEVSFMITKYLFSKKGSFPELFHIEGEEMYPGRNDPQLWAIAAYQYFKLAQKSGNKSQIGNILGLMPVIQTRDIAKFYLTKVKVIWLVPKLKTGIKRAYNNLGKYTQIGRKNLNLRRYLR